MNNNAVFAILCCRRLLCFTLQHASGVFNKNGLIKLKSAVEILLYFYTGCILTFMAITYIHTGQRQGIQPGQLATPRANTPFTITLNSH